MNQAISDKLYDAMRASVFENESPQHVLSGLTEVVEDLMDKWDTSTEPFDAGAAESLRAEAVKHGQAFVEKLTRVA